MDVKFYCAPRVFEFKTGREGLGYYRVKQNCCIEKNIHANFDLYRLSILMKIKKNQIAGIFYRVISGTWIELHFAVLV